VPTLSTRVKIIITTLCLLAALGVAVFAVINTVQAVHGFQQHRELVKAGDVQAIGSWMTIPYIAHFYHVPESYLYQTLDIGGPVPRHATLHSLATNYHKPVNQLIFKVQKAIILYRKLHPSHPHPPSVTATPSSPAHTATPVHQKSGIFPSGRTVF
jgi:hypothetical protein